MEEQLFRKEWAKVRFLVLAPSVLLKSYKSVRSAFEVHVGERVFGKDEESSANLD